MADHLKTTSEHINDARRHADRAICWARWSIAFSVIAVFAVIMGLVFGGK